MTEPKVEKMSAVAIMENWKVAVSKEMAVAAQFEDNWGFLKAREEETKVRRVTKIHTAKTLKTCFDSHVLSKQDSLSILSMGRLLLRTNEYRLQASNMGAHRRLLITLVISFFRSNIMQVTYRYSKAGGFQRRSRKAATGDTYCAIQNDKQQVRRPQINPLVFALIHLYRARNRYGARGGLELFGVADHGRSAAVTKHFRYL